MPVLSPDAPPALPFWIDGHAVLTLGERLFDVPAGAHGQVLRRAPVCGADAAQRAVAAARAAQSAWSAQPAEVRTACLAALGAGLAGYAPHFAVLLGEEAGLPPAEAARLIAAAQASLGAARASAPVAAVRALVPPEAGEVFLPMVQALSGILASGASAVVLSDVRCPSALLALAELATRCALPDGVFNLVHGDAASAAAIAAALAGDGAA